MDNSSSSSAAAASRRPGPRRRVSWCCAFNVPPSSPETLKASQRTHHHHHHHHPHSHPKTLLHRTCNANTKTEKPRDSFSKLSANSFPNSPQSSKSSLSIVGRIDPRRILSPGRVSPIDSDPTQEPGQSSNLANPSRSGSFRSQAERISMTQLHAESFRAPPQSPQVVPEDIPVPESGPSENAHNVFDVRLNLRSKKGACLVLELSSEVLCSNSEVFADLVAQYKRGFSCPGDAASSSSVCRIEVPDVENLGIFRETLELMFEDDIAKRLLKVGVYRCTDILEVSASIMFRRGVTSCLKYIEAVPWTEEEEEKLKSLFTRVKFDESTVKDIMARLYMLDAVNPQQNLARQLVCSITSCTDSNARNELKSLVKGLLSKSSVYEKDQSDLNKEEIYSICHTCISTLVSLFEEASGNISNEKLSKSEKPLIERISREVDNINWLLEILLDRQMGRNLWRFGRAKKGWWSYTGFLLRWCGMSSAGFQLFCSLPWGRGRLQCGPQARSGLLQEWFGPMLSDFGWLQRCRKGLEMKALEESMGQVLLTLPLKQQYVLFMEWFRCFSKQGSECPNLSKAFQIWWRRSFTRGSETHSIESR